MFLNIKKKILISIATSLISLILVIFLKSFPKHFLTLTFFIKKNADENNKIAYCQEINFTYVLIENFLESFQEKYNIDKYDVYINRDFEIKIQIDSFEYISDKIVFDLEQYFSTNTAKRFIETFKKNITSKTYLKSQSNQDKNWIIFQNEFKSSEFCKLPIKHFSTLRNNYHNDKIIFIFSILFSVFIFTFIFLKLINKK